MMQRDVTVVRDDFNGSGELGSGWQWMIGRKPVSRIADGRLILEVGETAAVAVQSITAPSFVAETAVEVARISTGTFAGLAVYGDRVNHLALVTDGSFLPPWDRGVRTGLYVAGSAGATASFDYFSSIPDDGKLFAP
ncbi:MAG: hypothetical protein EXS37_08180 [Opitutus sp.]|nr:hypothetical protein [Opitutus sp.]